MLILKLDDLLHLLLNHAGGIEPDYSLRPDYVKMIVFTGLYIAELLFGLLLVWRMYEKTKRKSR